MAWSGLICIRPECLSYEERVEADSKIVEEPEDELSSRGIAPFEDMCGSRAGSEKSDVATFNSSLWYL